MKQKSHYCFGNSEKKDGAMNFSAPDMMTHRKEFLTKIGLDFNKMVSTVLTHGSNIQVVTSEHAGQILQGFDGLVTSDPGIILTVTTADCLPVYFFDAHGRAVGLAHAGWRGVENRILVKMVEVMKSTYQIGPEDISVLVGPHIKQCHFEVQTDTADLFSAYKTAILDRDGKIFIDLGLIVKQQLEIAGVIAKNITISKECTYCLPEKYYSFRRDKPERVEAVLAYAMIA